MGFADSRGSSRGPRRAKRAFSPRRRICAFRRRAASAYYPRFPGDYSAIGRKNAESRRPGAHKCSFSPNFFLYKLRVLV
jgi:hypothetical protein